jgi:hypothetical protein
MAEAPHFSGSYDPSDVVFLMKPVVLAPTERHAKERLIQSGARHYSEMVAQECVPDPRYLALYEAALARNGSRLAQDVASLAAALTARSGPGEIVLVSLARAGTPIGVLLARAIRGPGHAAAHYSISIIRGRGIDRVALAHIAARHDPARIVFVDGWTGKGAIASELRACLAERPFGIAPLLAVIADPAGVADIAATHEDYLIPCGLLNAIGSGLISRSILNADVVGPEDFHGCVVQHALAPHDRSRAFVDSLSPAVALARPWPPAAGGGTAARACIDTVMARFGTSDRNRIKPGIAEATRALLRRVPERLLLRDASDPDVAHLLHLAGRAGVPIETLPPAAPYRAIAIIRQIAPAATQHERRCARARRAALSSGYAR